MRKFPNKAALIEAKAESQHQANLVHGGVFGADGKRTSDLAMERQSAAKKALYVGADYARIHGLPEAIAAWYIKGVGYAPV